MAGWSGSTERSRYGSPRWPQAAGADFIRFRPRALSRTDRQRHAGRCVPRPAGGDSPGGGRPKRAELLPGAFATISRGHAGHPGELTSDPPVHEAAADAHSSTSSCTCATPSSWDLRGTMTTAGARIGGPSELLQRQRRQPDLSRGSTGDHVRLGVRRLRRAGWSEREPVGHRSLWPDVSRGQVCH
jgi:hypothetical protein